MIVSVRLPIADSCENGLVPEEAGRIAALCEEAGADMINLGYGIFYGDEYFETDYREDGDRLEATAIIKNQVSIPVVANGKIKTAELAEKALNDGMAELISFGRQFLCDPYWPMKARTGKEKEIRYCISCDECISRGYDMGSPRCTLNPYLGLESKIDEVSLPLAGERKNIVIVGAGPAGITAAVTAARRGHQVTLLEKKSSVCGNVTIAAKPMHKELLNDYCEYLENELKNSTVKVYTGVEADFRTVQSYKPDKVIIATGSSPVTLRIEGVELATQVWDLLGDDFAGIDGRKVVLIGGGVVSCETALSLAVDHNCDVTIIEMLPRLGQGMNKFYIDIIPNELEKNGVHVELNARVSKITENSVEYLDLDGKTHSVECESAIFAVGARPVGAELTEALLDDGIDTVVIGDAMVGGLIKEANRAGLLAGYFA